LKVSSAKDGYNVEIVIPVFIEDSRLAIDLFEQYAPQGRSARDLIHSAVMKKNGLTEIISTDDLFDHIEGIIRRDPLDLFSSNATIS
jgi:predicted nucleic acid-binding protein